MLLNYSYKEPSSHATDVSLAECSMAVSDNDNTILILFLE